MSQDTIIILISATITLGWNVFLTARIRTLESNLIKTKEENQDAKITSKVHDMLDPDLVLTLSKDLGGDKPSAGK